MLAIRASAKGVDLYFGRGKELSDPDKLLKGSAKLVRFIHMDGASTLKRPAIARLIDAAIAGTRTPFARTGRGPVVVRSTTAEEAFETFCLTRARILETRVSMHSRFHACRESYFIAITCSTS